jgi:hypothetical protein
MNRNLPSHVTQVEYAFDVRYNIVLHIRRSDKRFPSLTFLCGSLARIPPRLHACHVPCPSHPIYLNAIIILRRDIQLYHCFVSTVLLFPHITPSHLCASTPVSAPCQYSVAIATHYPISLVSLYPQCLRPVRLFRQSVIGCGR